LKLNMVARSAAFAVVVCLAPVVQAQEFIAYEGKHAVQEGEGGTKKVVDGIDIWTTGTPPHKFKLLGYIDDRRHKSGIRGWIAMSSLESDIADIARKQGGNAVILVAEGNETVGFIGTGDSSTNTTIGVRGNTANVHSQTSDTAGSVAVQKHNSRYAAVKYIDDAEGVVSPSRAAPEPKPTSE